MGLTPDSQPSTHRSPGKGSPKVITPAMPGPWIPLSSEDIVKETPEGPFSDEPSCGYLFLTYCVQALTLTDVENAPIQPLGASYCVPDDETESRTGIHTCQHLRVEALYDPIAGEMDKFTPVIPGWTKALLDKPMRLSWLLTEQK